MNYNEAMSTAIRDFLHRYDNFAINTGTAAHRGPYPIPTPVLEEEDRDLMAVWQIDQEGRIFFEGQYVAKIERRADSDGLGDPPSVAFCAMRVAVEDPTADPLHRRVFETRVMGTSADDRLTAEEWEAINTVGGGPVRGSLEAARLANAALVQRAFALRPGHNEVAGPGELDMFLDPFGVGDAMIHDDEPDG